MSPPGPPPPKHLGTARPTCERCGHELEIEILGTPATDEPGDTTQIHFKLPARHTCRRPAVGPGDTNLDLREAPTPGAGAPEPGRAHSPGSAPPAAK
jgi:hypothetical protein